MCEKNEAEGHTHPERWQTLNHSAGHHHHHDDVGKAEFRKGDLASRRAFLASLVSACVLLPYAYGDDKSPESMAEQFRRMSEKYEKEGLAEPFRGITTNREVLPGLFEIARRACRQEGIRNAAQKFVASLNNVQLAKTMFPVDDVQWRKWMNQHFYVRDGISMQEMAESQRELAFGMMRVSLSTRGFGV